MHQVCAHNAKLALIGIILIVIPFVQQVHSLIVQTVHYVIILAKFALVLHLLALLVLQIITYIQHNACQLALRDTLVMFQPELV